MLPTKWSDKRDGTKGWAETCESICGSKPVGSDTTSPHVVQVRRRVHTPTNLTLDTPLHKRKMQPHQHSTTKFGLLGTTPNINWPLARLSDFEVCVARRTQDHDAPTPGRAQLRQPWQSKSWQHLRGTAKREKREEKRGKETRQNGWVYSAGSCENQMVQVRCCRIGAKPPRITIRRRISGNAMPRSKTEGAS